MKELSQYDDLINDVKTRLSHVINKNELDNLRSYFLGKKSYLSELLKTIKDLDPKIRKKQGTILNLLKKTIEDLIKDHFFLLEDSELQNKLFTEKIDVTLPGIGMNIGSIHPLMQTLARIEEIFHSIGFTICDGPEIENEWMNFTALNNPHNHPARSMQDTFYIDMLDEHGMPLLLRTHTSAMQVRFSKCSTPPIKVLIPGRTYRVDNDATHSPMFHQVEGLWVDKNISFSQFKGLYTHFLKVFFEKDDLRIRFRPSFFPFTEPSAEIDIMFSSEQNNESWLEVSGAGQVHPNVIKNFGLDPEEYTGFAFGSGLERLAMLRYEVHDLRQFYDGDLRFLKQF